ncbi:unnamed protein product [Nezara viridula]|nr:unnamed protein product [Nezara viridula]
MVHCCAFGCSNSSEKGFSMKRFPSNPQRRKVWAAKVKRENWTPTNATRICEAHFTPDMFEQNRADGRPLLKWNAIPTIFPHIPEKKSRKHPKKRSSNRRTVEQSASAVDMPGSICSVAMCKSNAIISKKLGDNVRFFTFPKDVKLRREWVKRCSRSEKFNPINKRICSKHFKPDDFEDAIEAMIQDRLPKILKRDCIPSLNLKPEKILNVNLSDTKKTRLERAAKRKQKDFIKRILEAEKEHDFDSDGSVKSDNKEDNMEESWSTDMDQNDETGLTSQDLITDKGGL